MKLMVDAKDQFDSNLRNAIKKRRHVAVIPVGSIEQHGPHLPISTDSDIVTEIAKLVSKKANFLLLPTLHYGVSFEHAPFFNLSVKKSTLSRLLVDLCLSLASNGINTIFILNGHHGNQMALQNITKKISKLSKRKTKAFVFSYWHFMKRPFDHAGFVETSLMLTTSNKVKMNLALKGITTEGMTQKEKLRISKLASKSFPSVTKTGVWGDPRKASAKEGKKILLEIVRNLEKKCQTCLTGTSPNLHQ